MTAPAMLTVGEAATRLAVSERQVRRLLAARALGSVRIGRAVRIGEADLDAYVDRQRRPALEMTTDDRGRFAIRALGDGT